MPKIIGGSLREHRIRVREKLFAALSSLMAERGFSAITLSDIATVAGVGRTAVYNHFTDKEALLLGFITHETEQYVAELERALCDVDDPVSQLRTYIRHQARLRRFLNYAAPGNDLRQVLSKQARERLRDHAQIVEEVLHRILRRGIAAGQLPDQDLNTAVRLVNACLTGRFIPEEPVGRERAIDATETFILRAVGAQAPVASQG